MKINLEDDGVFYLELTVEQCRNFDEAVTQQIEEALDEPQGFVFSEQGTEAYLVIKVTQ